MNHFCFTHLRFHRYKPCPKCALKKLRKRVRGATDDVAGDLIRRYIELRGNPKLLDQDAFGVCGMTSVVYVLLRRKPSVVDKLFSAIFVDIKGKGKFRTATKGHHEIDLSSLARAYERKDYKGQKPGGRQPRQGLLVDYLLSRALGYLLKKTDADRYKREKADFNVKFDYDPNKNYKHITRVGTLALRTRNVAYILKDIVGAQNVFITRNSTRARPEPSWARAADVGVNEDTFNTAQALNQKFAFRFPQGDRTRFAIAAIFSDLHKNRNFQLQDNIHVPGQPAAWTLDQVRVARNPHNPISNNSARDNRDAGMEYNHWVVIEGFKQVGNQTQLLIWTWGKYYRLNVRNENLLSYIQDVIFGRFDP